MSIPLSKKACDIIECIVDFESYSPGAIALLKKGKSKAECDQIDADQEALQPKACRTWEERPKGNQYVRKMRFRKAGDYMRGHLHHFDHSTIVFTGAIHVIAVKPDGTEVDAIFSAPKPGGFSDRNEGWVLIQANTHHEIIALEDYTEAWCCFSHRGDHGEVVQKQNSNLLAYASKGENSDELAASIKLATRVKHG